MSNSIPAEMQEFVDHAIASGRYETEQDVLTEAFRVWRQREEELERLRVKLQSGIDQLNRGEGIDGEIVLNELRRKLTRLKESEV